MKRALFLGAALLALPGSGLAAGAAIEHDPVGCLVAEKYPKLVACFQPAGNLARARVYFKAETGTDWYYVEMKPEAPCFTGTLPKPSKSTTMINYYIEALDKAASSSRTEEFSPTVVGSPEQCSKKPAAFVNNASVAVSAAAGGPALPVGFAAGGIAGAGGLSAAVVAAGVAGAGAATVGVVAAAKGDEPTLPPAIVVSTTVPTTQPPPPTTLAPTTTTTTQPRAANRPPSVVFSAKPSKGDSPLTVTFNLCKSTDPDGDGLRYVVDFGDGERSQGSCNVDHTYTATLSSSGRRAASGQEQVFTATGCVSDRQPDHEVCLQEKIVVTVPSSYPACDGLPPSVSITVPTEDLYEVYTPIALEAAASAAEGISEVRFYASEISGGYRSTPRSPLQRVLIGTVTSPPYAMMWNPAVCNDSFEIEAEATDRCGESGLAPETRSLYWIYNPAYCGMGRSGTKTVSWHSDLAVPDGRAQLVVNGKQAVFPGDGPRAGRLAAVRGENRFEGVLVSATGPGTWRLEVSGEVRPGSLRVVAGEVESAGGESVTFRLQGRPGERVVFTFETR